MTYGRQFIPASQSHDGHGNWRIHDSADNRVATCYDAGNAQNIVDALNGLTLTRAQRINAERSDRWMAGSVGWTVLEVAGELAGELGELANVCKKLRRSELGVPGNKLTDAELRAHAADECGDVLIVLMLVASKLKINLEAATRRVFNRKSEQMGFPERL